MSNNIMTDGAPAAPTPPSPPGAARNALRTAVLIWLAAAAAFAASGAFRYLPPASILGLIWAPTLGTIAFLRRREDLRAYLATADLAPAFLLQAVRAPVGAGFLALGAEGLLDPSFVRVAGPGDIVAGIGALVAWAAWRSGGRRGRWLVLGWNFAALIDILAVMVTAQRVLFFGGGMDAMQGFLQFPLPMIPTFLVPMVLLTHLWIFLRAR